jgi:hypothetical protein
MKGDRWTAEWGERKVEEGYEESDVDGEEIKGGETEF